MQRRQVDRSAWGTAIALIAHRGVQKMTTLRKSRLLTVAGLLLLGLLFAPVLGPHTALVLASDTPNPTSVTIAGSMQSELGCPGDWQPECGVTHLTYDANDDVWQGSWNIPAGS